MISLSTDLNIVVINRSLWNDFDLSHVENATLVFLSPNTNISNRGELESLFFDKQASSTLEEASTRLP